ncbi:MAG: cupin domain-containing protein [Gemmatimonadales bacterium]
MKSFLIIAGMVGSLVVAPAAAQVNFKATPILQSGVTVGGAPFAYPKTDSAEVTALLLEIGPGGETGRHMHPNPTFVYVLEGAIEVEVDGSTAHTYKAGDTFLEVLNAWHNGKNKGTTPARILVVFSGVKGKPNLIRPS